MASSILIIIIDNGVVYLAQYVSWFRFVHLLNLDLLTHKIGRKSPPLSRLCEIHKLTLTPVNVVLPYSELTLNRAQHPKQKYAHTKIYEELFY